ncbi:MAG: carboxypeptidase-like regulatory domain-containing protein [Prolixibacteraceae bacterium]|jgi:hypothetical protein|nr:carboxypeptidase-like regulatory domain-containing protein [Prolixibacteraceae bacterium]
MKTIILSIILVALSTSASFSKSNNAKAETPEKASNIDTIELSGFVTDKISNEALVGVEVKIEGTELKTYTDFDGKFSFKNMLPGEYNIVSSYISYEKVVTELDNLSKNNNELTIKLETSN